MFRAWFTPLPFVALLRDAPACGNSTNAPEAPHAAQILHQSSEHGGLPKRLYLAAKQNSFDSVTYECFFFVRTSRPKTWRVFLPIVRVF